MSLEQIREILGWCCLLNLGLLLWWWMFLIFAHDFVYRFHTRWFELSRERFDAIHYSGMAFLKIGVLAFQLAPYVALHIVA